MSIMQTAAELMAISARTAPKAKGQDYLELKVVSDPDVLKSIAEEMIRYSEETGRKGLSRDGNNLLKSEALLLLSLKEPQHAGLNCGACGFKECSKLTKTIDFEFAGPVCAWRLIDFGIALGSAAKTASILNIDNRIMYTIGIAARKLGIIEGDMVAGIPISASGKSIYFDR